METTNDNANLSSSEMKQRHGCVTTWLIIMIIANSFITILYLFAGDFISEHTPGGIPSSMLILLGVVGIANVVFSVLLLLWKKIGFWGFVVTSIAAVVINLRLDLGVGQSVMGLVGLAILFAVLQIKKDNVKAWDNLE